MGNMVGGFRRATTGTRGELVDQLTDSDFQVPTTIARFGNGLYLPNARFDTPRRPTQRTRWCASTGERLRAPRAVSAYSVTA